MRPILKYKTTWCSHRVLSLKTVSSSLTTRNSRCFPTLQYFLLIIYPLGPFVPRPFGWLFTGGIGCPVKVGHRTGQHLRTGTRFPQQHGANRCPYVHPDGSMYGIFELFLPTIGMVSGVRSLSICQVPWSVWQFFYHLDPLFVHDCGMNGSKRRWRVRAARPWPPCQKLLGSGRRVGAWGWEGASRVGVVGEVSPMFGCFWQAPGADHVIYQLARELKKAPTGLGSK